MLSQMKTVFAKNPANSILNNLTVTLGQSAAAVSRESWVAEFEKTVSNSLMMFFVCLFGDIQDMMIIDMSAVSTNKVKDRGQIKVRRLDPGRNCLCVCVSVCVCVCVWKYYYCL